MAGRAWTVDGVADQLAELGVEPGGVLLVHTAFRAARPIEGGPAGLIEALRRALGSQGTLVLPSWTDDDDTPFDPLRTPAARALGIVPDTFWRMPGVLRGQHPFALAAAGPLAAEVVAGPPPIPPQAPDSAVGRVHRYDGQVLLIGIGHECDTTLHLAEVMAGVPYGVPKHVTVLRDGRPERVDYLENDHCCERFALAEGWLRERGLQRDGPVGHARARLARARDIVQVALERLSADPLVFLHPPGDGCAECDLARASVGIGPGS
jgi:aminoglycoside N3'-acetyltransferase